MTNYLVSWNKPARMFRFRQKVQDQGLMCKEAYGTARITGTDNVNYRLHFQCDVVNHKEGGVLRVQGPEPNYQVPAGARYVGTGKWRCCARRSDGHWRMMLETDKAVRYFIVDIKGDWNLVWDDGGSHLFHIGKLYIDEANELAYVTH